MKSGDAVFLHLAATVARSGARPDPGDVRLRGNRGGGKQSGPNRTRTAGLAARRRRDPGRAVRRLHRGRLPGHAARRRHADRHPRAFGAIMVGRQRHSQTRRGAGPAGRHTRRAASTSTDAYTAKGCRRCASTAAWQATSFPTRHRSRSISASRPIAASSRRCTTCVTCFDGLDVHIEQTDAAAGALPGLTKPAAAALVEAAGGQVRAKYGWTDVARLHGFHCSRVHPDEQLLAGAANRRDARRRRRVPRLVDRRGMDWEAWLAEVALAKAEFARLISATPTRSPSPARCRRQRARSRARSTSPARRTGVVVSEAEFPTRRPRVARPAAARRSVSLGPLCRRRRSTRRVRHADRRPHRVVSACHSYYRQRVHAGRRGASRASRTRRRALVRRRLSDARQRAGRRQGVRRRFPGRRATSST